MGGGRGRDRGLSGQVLSRRAELPNCHPRLVYARRVRVKGEGSAAHGDDLATAVAHFNATFRLRYGLLVTSVAQIERAEGFAEAWQSLSTVRADGVEDASCATIARAVLSVVPRDAIGFVDGFGKAHVQAPDQGEEHAYWSHTVLLVNPLGGRDNWGSVARFVRGASQDARKSELAGLASERRRDDEAIWARLTKAAAEDERAEVLPPDEAFSSDRAAEVSYIYSIPVETLRAWKQRHRSPLAARKPGKPKNR